MPAQTLADRNRMATVERLEKPAFEVLCELGFNRGVLQIARLEHKGRSVWKTQRIAEKYAREYTEKHGFLAYVSLC